MTKIAENPKLCKYCGKPVKTKDRQFCSRQCSGRAIYIAMNPEKTKKWLLLHNSDYGIRSEYLLRLQYYHMVHGGH